MGRENWPTNRVVPENLTSAEMSVEVADMKKRLPEVVENTRILLDRITELGFDFDRMTDPQIIDCYGSLQRLSNHSWPLKEEKSQ